MSGLAESLEKRLQIGEASSLPLSTVSAPVTYRRSSVVDNSRRQKNHRDSGIGSDSGTAILTAASLSDSDSAASHRSLLAAGKVGVLMARPPTADGCRQHDSDSSCRQHDSDSSCRQHDSDSSCRQHDSDSSCRQHDSDSGGSYSSCEVRSSKSGSSEKRTSVRESKRDESKRKLQEKLIQLLTELIQTERKYVRDLEQTCSVYIPNHEFQYRKKKTTSDRRRRGSVKDTRFGGRDANPGLSVYTWLPNLFCYRPGAELTPPRINKCESSASNATNVYTICTEISADIKSPNSTEVRQMLGNIDALHDYHNRVMLPRLEGAVMDGDSGAIRKLFQHEESKLSTMYGRYCVNKTRSSVLVDQYIQYFAHFQLKNHLPLRIDAELIKPIQRITRYHMFLSSLAKTSRDLGLNGAAKDFTQALDGILRAVNHTNTMMWIGQMESCPLELASQGQLLKEGRITSKLVRERRRSFQDLLSRNSVGTPSYLFLFQHSLILCRELSSFEDSCDPRIVYATHISVNQLRLRDTCGEDTNTFELQRVEGVKGLLHPLQRVDGSSLHPLHGSMGGSEPQEGAIARIICANESEKNAWVSAINAEIKSIRVDSTSIEYFDNNNNSENDILNKTTEFDISMLEYI